MTEHRDEEVTLQSMFLLKLPFEIPTLRVFRRNVGAARMKGRHVVTFGVKGQCDTYGIADYGRHIECELKALHGRLNPFQKAWRAWCLEHHVPYMLAIEKRGEAHEQTVDRWIAEMKALAT